MTFIDETFINSSTSIGAIMEAGRNNVAGTAFLTLLLILLFLFIFCIMFQIPYEFSMIILLPIIVVIMAFQSGFTGIFLAIGFMLGTFIAKNWLFR